MAILTGDCHNTGLGVDPPGFFYPWMHEPTSRQWVQFLSGSFTPSHNTTTASKWVCEAYSNQLMRHMAVGSSWWYRKPPAKPALIGHGWLPLGFHSAFWCCASASNDGEERRCIVQDQMNDAGAQVLGDIRHSHLNPHWHISIPASDTTPLTPLTHPHQGAMYRKLRTIRKARRPASRPGLNPLRAEYASYENLGPLHTFPPFATRTECHSAGGACRKRRLSSEEIISKTSEGEPQGELKNPGTGGYTTPGSLAASHHGRVVKKAMEATMGGRWQVTKRKCNIEDIFLYQQRGTWSEPCRTFRGLSWECHGIIQQTLTLPISTAEKVGPVMNAKAAIFTTDHGTSSILRAAARNNHRTETHDNVKYHNIM